MVVQLYRRNPKARHKSKKKAYPPTTGIEKGMCLFSGASQYFAREVDQGYTLLSLHQERSAMEAVAN
jgi:hypothetical protein